MIEGEKDAQENDGEKQQPSAVFPPEPVFSLRVFSDQLFYMPVVDTVLLHCCSLSFKTMEGNFEKLPEEGIKLIR